MIPTSAQNGCELVNRLIVPPSVGSPVGRALSYSISKNITGGEKQQEARAGVDYIKVN